MGLANSVNLDQPAPASFGLSAGKFEYSKTCLKIPPSKRQQFGFQDHREHSAILSIFICGERSGRVLDSRPKGRGFEPHRRHCVVVLEQDTFILA